MKKLNWLKFMGGRFNLAADALEEQGGEKAVTVGQLVMRRFLRSKTAIAGIIILIFMLLFCFVFSLDIFNSYSEYEQFFDPDISFSAEQLQVMLDKELIPGNAKAQPTTRKVESAILGTYTEETGAPIKIAEALKNSAEGEVTYRLYRVSFRLAEKNELVKLGICANTDVQLYNRMPPTWQHLLGTDRDGNDVFTRLQYGGKVSLMIGFVCVVFSLFIGVTLGGISGYYKGFADGAIMRLVDIFNSIPTFPIIILLNSFMRTISINEKSKIFYLMFVIGVLSWPGAARLVRGQVLTLREQEFMVATESVGLRPSRRIFRHLLPNVMPQIIVNATLEVGDVILFESALSFLGLGVSPPYSTWGIMVNSVNDVFTMLDCLYVWIPPGVCILLTVMAINFVGDGLRDAFDPKMRR